MVSYRDWVVETSSTTGTGTYSLSGAAPAGTSYFTFRQRFSNGEDEIVYWVVNADRTKWEKNRFGTLTYGTPDTLTRNVVESTNGDAAVSWVGGDAPLRLYVVPDADAEEFAISMGLGAARPEVLKFGLWADQNDVAAGIHTLKLFDGTNDVPLGTINVADAKFIPAPTAINFPPGHIQGLTYGNNSGDATNDIDIFAGSCADKTGVYPLVLGSTLVKRLDAAWAVGTNQGGLDTGSIANADYFIHLIGRSDTGVVDGLFSLSLSSPTMPADYDYSKPIGWIRRSGGAIIAFKTYETPGGGLDYHWGTGITDMSTVTFTSNSNDNLRTMSVPVGIPAIWNALVSGQSGNTWGFLIKTPGVTANKAAWFLQANAGIAAAGQASILTNTSAQVAFDVSTTAGGVGVTAAVTYGFTWSRR